MKILWIILAVLSFIGGQVYLVSRLWKLDELQEHRPGDEAASADEDSCGYPDEDVVE